MKMVFSAEVCVWTDCLPVLTRMLFPSVYCGNIEYYTKLIQAEKVVIDQCEHFIKQSYRSRCDIAGPNGRQMLPVPVHRKNHDVMRDIKIDYSMSWNKNHWQSLRTCYKNSPYFDDYAFLLDSIYQTPPKYLIELNTMCHKTICQMLGIKLHFDFSESFLPYSKKDHRIDIDPKSGSTFTHPEYIQVFGDKNGFLKNLSILDLIFNQGPESLNILRRP